MPEVASQTLDFVGRELNLTLTEARNALENYVEQPDNISLLERCTQELHQVQGVLRVLEIYGAALLAEEMEGGRPTYFDIESWRVIAESSGGSDGATAEATVKVRAGGERFAVIGEGNGPVNALDHALRQAIERIYPDVAQFRLIDFRVRILDQGLGTDAVTRVLIETSDGKNSWVTVGVGANIIEASWEALLDALTYGLRLHEVAVRS